MRSRCSSKLCKGQHERRSMKRRSPCVKLQKSTWSPVDWSGVLHACLVDGRRSYANANMIAGRGSGVLHACVVGGRRSYAKVNMIAGRWSGVLHMCVVGGRRSYAKVNMIAGRWSGDLHACVVGGRWSCASLPYPKNRRSDNWKSPR